MDPDEEQWVDVNVGLDLAIDCHSLCTGDFYVAMHVQATWCKCVAFGQPGCPHSRIFLKCCVVIVINHGQIRREGGRQ